MARLKGASARFARLNDNLRESVPRVYSWSEDAGNFRELRFKLRDDGSLLVVAKGHFSDGTPSVCFGVGYGLAGALLAVESTISADAWKIDKPWRSK